MIKVHHLENSRSQRILWLLEELGVGYEVVPYARDPKSRFAPPELKSIHPLGKSPVIEDEGRVVAESGAIVEYLARKYGGGKLFPPADSPAHVEHLQWMHFAEGSAMFPLVLALYVGRLGEAGAPLRPRIQSELANYLGFIDRALAGRDFLMGAEPMAADFMMSFVVEAAVARGHAADLPNLRAYQTRIRARPAYQRAIERGGPFRLA